MVDATGTGGGVGLGVYYGFEGGGVMSEKMEPEGVCDNCKEMMGFYVRGERHCRICGMFKTTHPERFKQRGDEEIPCD